jgi:hypothetical protein
MRRNRKTIMGKIQDVMGIKSGKYCSSDVSVVSLNGNSGGAAVPAFNGESKEQYVEYINCTKKEKVTINYMEIQMNNNIINDCVLGGSVTLNDLNGYVVNYGDTICPVIKMVRSCGEGKNMVANFGITDVTDRLTYYLTFGNNENGCYTILGDVDPNVKIDVEVLTAYQSGGNCETCGPPQINTLIQSCGSGLIYSVNSNVAISLGGICLLTFNNGMTPNGCYTILGTTTNGPLDTIISTSDDYGSCENCKNSQS